MIVIQSLKFKINSSILFTFLIITLAFSAVLTVFELQRRENAFKQIEISLDDLLVQNREQIGNEIFAEQEKAIQSTLNTIVKRPGLLAANAYDADGMILATTQKNVALADLTQEQIDTLSKGSTSINQTWQGQSVLTHTALIKAYGEDVGFWRIEYSLATVERETFLIIAIFSTLLLTMFLFMAVLLNTFLSRMVLKPVFILKNAMQRVKEGNLGEQAVLPREDGKDEISQMAQTFNKMSIDLAESYQMKVAKEIAEAAAHARSEFLDNSGQGFLSFGMDLLIDKEYSRECENIFGHGIGGESIAGLLSPGDEGGMAGIEKSFNRVLSEENDYKLELYLSLLKKEYSIEDKFVEAEYHIITKGRMMLILTDVTKQKKLEHEVQLERNRLKFVVSAVREANYFFEILSDFDWFENERFPELIKSEDEPAQILAELYRNVHTFKGLFAQQDFMHIPGALHQLEEQLSKIRRNEAADSAEFYGLLETFKCQDALKKDLGIIESVLGADFLKQKERRSDISISREQAEKIEAMAKKILKLDPDILDKETYEVLHETQKILYVNLKYMIEFYLDSAVKLAARLGKEIEVYEVNGDDIFVDTSIYTPFTRTLVHVFRNAVDHGIETPDEREELEKEDETQLTCSIREEKDQLVISIFDNGRGLNSSRIRDKAVELGIFAQEDIQNISDEEVHRLIFKENFSTSEKVTELSGRGVGLDSVRAELAKLCGEVEIETESGKGTTFRFIIPMV